MALSPFKCLQAWSACVDAERSADNDFTETCKEAVRDTIFECSTCCCRLFFFFPETCMYVFADHSSP